MEAWQIAAICLGIGIAALVVALVFLFRNKGKKDKSQSRVEPVTVIDGVRYTHSDLTQNTDGSVKATHLQGDKILERGKEFLVDKKGLLAGKYTVLSTDENTKAFNIRIGGFVREYSHMDSIVLAEGDTISAVSHTVILR